MKTIFKNRKTKEIGSVELDRKWKEGNKTYLRELQIFLDKVDNIKDYELKRSVTNQMMICDEILTKLAEEKFKEFYNFGYKSAKNG